MPYGTLGADVVQSSTANTPPQFNDGNGTQTGTLCRAWVNFNGTGTVALRASFNVSSITDNGTGDYTVNFTTAMPDANYAVSGTYTRSTNIASNTTVFGVLSLTSAGARISTIDTSATSTDGAYVGVSIFR